MNNINFKGAYYLENPPVRMWHKIQKDIVSKGAITREFQDSKDKFFVLDNCFDNSMVKYLTKKRFKFTYYPNIKPLEFNLDYTKKMIDEIFKIHNITAINTRKSLLQHVASIEKSKPNVRKICTYKWKPNDHIDKTLEFLKLSKDDCIVVKANNVTVLYKKKKNDFLSNLDKESLEKIASVSPNDMGGINYVYVYPKNYYESAKRFELDQNGNLKTEYEHSDFKEFFDKFYNCVKIDKKRFKNMA